MARARHAYYTAKGSPAYGQALMLARVPRVASRRDPTSRALGRALRRAGINRLSGAERQWMDRIDARRRELIADETSVAPGFEAKSGTAPEWITRGRGDQL